MEVERRWGREPGWFATQPKHTQTMLLADLYLTLETPEQAKKQARKAQQRELDRRKQNYLKQYGH